MLPDYTNRHCFVQALWGAFPVDRRPQPDLSDSIPH